MPWSSFPPRSCPVHKPRAGTRTIPRTRLAPQNDSRDEDTRSYDDFDSRTMVEGMNEVEDVFHHRLKWSEVRIRDLFASHSPFCELRFDAARKPCSS